MTARPDQVIRARRTTRRQIIFHWLMAVALVAVSVVGTMPLWLRFVVAAVGLMQVGLAYAWQGIRRRMDSAYPSD